MSGKHHLAPHLSIDADGCLALISREVQRLLGCSQAHLAGHPIAVLAQQGWPQLAAALQPPEHMVPQERLVQEQGKQLLVRLVPSAVGWDAVISHQALDLEAHQLVARYWPGKVEDLGGEDLLSFRRPIKRELSVLVIEWAELVSCTQQWSPEEIRAGVNSCLEEIVAAVDASRGSIAHLTGDAVISLFGAPRQELAHALMAVETAIRIQSNLRQVLAVLHRQGLEWPGCGCGIDTGAAVVGCLGPGNRRRYTALGEPIHLAGRLAAAAAPGEILCSENTVAELISSMPGDWRHDLHQGDPVPLDAFGHLLGVQPLEPGLAGRVVNLGTAQEERLRFRWLYRLALNRRGDSVAVVAVEGNLGAFDHSGVRRRTQASTERRIGRYRLQRRLGRGGMGEVFLALDPSGEAVALKTLIGTNLVNQTQLQRFQQEARVLARLEHYNICQLLDVGEVEGLAFLTMQFVDGVSLAEILDAPRDQAGNLAQLASEVRHRLESSAGDQRSKDSTPCSNPASQEEPPSHPLPEQQAIAIAIAIAEAVQHAHERGILHRDLKPQNVMISLEGRVVVMDFGLAKVMDDDSDRHLSQSDVLLGTASYMSPEQARSARDIDERTDVYSLGAILYEMLSGKQHIIVVGNLIADAARLQSHEPVPLHKLMPGIHRDLSLIVNMAMARRPVDRYLSMQRFAGDLRRYRDGLPLVARPPGVLNRLADWSGRHPTWAVTVLVVLVVLATSNLVYMSVLAEQRQVADEVRDQARQALIQAQREVTARQQVEAKNRRFQASLEQSWTEVLVESFTDPEVFAKRWRVLPPDRPWELTEEGLHLPAGGMGFVVFRHPLPGDVRLEFTATISGRFLDDLSCFANVPTKRLQSRFFQTSLPLHGYEFKVGGWDNTRNQINRLGEPLAIRLQSSLREGDMHHVVAEHRGTRLRLWLDDELILEADDSEPLAGGDLGVCGLSTWFADVTWHEVRISRLDLPQRVDLLELGQDLLREQKVDLAEELFEHALEQAVHPDTLYAAEDGLAQVRAHHRRLALLAQYEQQLQSVWPGQHFDLQIIDGELSLSLENLAIDDLEPLRGLELQRLRVHGIAIRSLEPLRGMPLRELVLVGCPVASLEPLAEAPLEHLELDRCGLSDLSPLQDLPLTWLDITGNMVDDLSPLRGMPLRDLRAGNNRIQDLTPLAGLPLQVLFLSRNAVRSLAPLEGMSLERLHASDNLITSLVPLRAMALYHLRIANNRIENIDPLRGMPINYLDISGNRIASLAAVLDMPLLKLFANRNLIEDLSPLAGLPLALLELADNRIQDLGPLAESDPLELDLRRNFIVDIAPLVRLRIRRLWLDDNPIASIAGLQRLPLQDLRLTRVPLSVDELAGLADSDIEHLFLDGCVMESERLQRLASLWDQQRPEWAWQARVLAAWQRQDVMALYELAKPGDADRRRLLLPLSRPRSSITQLLAPVQAHVAIAHKRAALAHSMETWWPLLPASAAVLVDLRAEVEPGWRLIRRSPRGMLEMGQLAEQAIVSYILVEWDATPAVPSE